MSGKELEIVGKTPPELAARESEMRTAAEAFADDQRAITLRMGERRGRRDVLQSLAKLVTVTDLEDIKAIKESAAYKGFQCRDEDGQLVTVTKWEDYCRLVEGRSREIIDNDLKNYAKFGGEGFNALRALGIGPAKMRELRLAGLPEDDNAALIQLAQAGDKEGVLDLAEELIVRQREQKQKLQAELEEARATVAAKDERADKREREIESLQAQVRRARGDLARATPDEQTERLRSLAQATAMQVRLDLTAGLDNGEAGEDCDSLYNRFMQLVEDAPQDRGRMEYMAGIVGELFTELRRLRDHFGLPIVNDHGAPDWMKGA